MARNRINDLRKEMNISQEILSAQIGTTQQAISRMEKQSYNIPSDILIKLSKFFNVSTDYILGISETKHNSDCLDHMTANLEENYGIILRYQNLNEINQKTFLCILERLEQAQCESKKQHERRKKNAQNSNM